MNSMGHVGINNCTFAENSPGTLRLVNASCVIENSIIAGSTEHAAVSMQGGVTFLTCSNIFGNVGGDWVGSIANQLGQEGNISEDPLFCAPWADDFSLAANSACLPGNHPHGMHCGLIGLLGEGCVITSVEPTSWGAVKSLYH